MPEDLDQDEFREVAWGVLSVADSLHLGWRNGRARGLFSAREDRGRWEPHVDWFPWASPRDKLECVVTYLHVRRQTDKLIIYSNMSDANFFKRASMYGVIRRVGDFNSFFERGDTVAVWESKNAWDR